MLPGLVRTRRSAMEAFHGTQAEKALSKGRPWVAAFVKTGRGPGRSAMLFAGLYRNHGGTQVARSEIAADPEIDWLFRTFGACRQLRKDGWTHWLMFDLSLDERMQDLQGRLTIDLRLPQSYVRLAENLDAPVLALHALSAFDADPPPWREICVKAGMLHALPAAWEARLREWRGIYLIVDEADGARYVGAAYGAENLLGRWREHVSGLLGITVGLAGRDPSGFRLSILERVSPDEPIELVVALEQTWITGLDTVRFGLNRSGLGEEAI